jgi:ribonuclease-3
LKRRKQLNPLSNGNPSLSPERLQKLNELCKNLNLSWNDYFLLEEAFTHRSFANEATFLVLDNERLELLGDSVLGLITVEFLFKQFPKREEGKLARMKSKLVSANALSQISERLSLIDFILVGRGEKVTADKNKNIKADLFEALLGAIYLDQGLESARSFLLPILKDLSSNLDKIEGFKDYKTLLQEFCQKRYKTVPIYKVIKEEGLDHDKEFTINVSLGGLFSKEGTGKNKRMAEQSAAKSALESLGS